MKYITTTLAAALVCSLTFGCNKPAEPPKPDPAKGPPAPPAATKPSGTPSAGPSLPVPPDGPTLPSTTPAGPKLPGAAGSVTGPALTPPPGGPELPKPGAGGPAPVPGFARRPAAADLKAVQEVIAKQMKMKPEDVKPTATLDELKMSNLDYSDAVEALEQRLNITISKLALKKAAGVEGDYVTEKLTVQTMADAINAIPPKQ